MNRILAPVQAALESLAAALARFADVLGEIIDALEADQPTRPDPEKGES